MYMLPQDTYKQLYRYLDAPTFIDLEQIVISSDDTLLCWTCSRL